MKYHLTCFIICCLQHTVVAQYIKPAVTETPEKNVVAQKSQLLHAIPAEANPVSADLNLLPILTKKKAWQPERGKNPEKLEAIKQEKVLQKMAGRIEKKSQDPEGLSSVSPVLGRNFPGNGNDGSSPMDNMLAISNGGWIVSVVNSNIQYFSVGGQRFFSKSIADFFNFAGVEDVCDPLVLYDNEADRFILFAQECSGESVNSSLLIGFSKSNNPNQGWWTYKLSGNPRKNNTWFDYPKMAVTKNELLISGNSFEGDEFKEAILFQIQKAGGFAGEKLNYQYWYGFPGAPFTLLPLGYGLSGSYGPGAYLVATEPEGATFVHLYDLTNEMSASDERIIHYKVPVEAYSPAANAEQKGTDRLLDNGDCRALSGFLLDTVIHMVFHTDQGDGWNGIQYLRIHTITRKAEGSTFGLAGSYDYSYPAVASLASSSGDKSVAIGFSRSSAEIYPQIRMVTCDGNFNWSSSLTVKSGASFVDYTAEGKNDVERWGDYSGIARWFGTPTPTVWLSASFGSLNNDWETWIAEVKRASTPTSTVEPVVQEGSLRVFPNPGVDIFRTSFTLEKPAALSVALFGIKGNLEKILYEGKAASGDHYFTFNRATLMPGSYILTVFADGEPASSTQVIIGN